jgi:hypothetical protein
MDATDPARREDPDAGRGTGEHGGRDGGRAQHAGRQRPRQRRPRHLPDVGGRGQLHEEGRGEPDDDPTVADRDRGRYGAGLAHGRLGRRRDFEVQRVWETVADEGGLEGHDRPAGPEGVGDLRGNHESIAEATGNGIVHDQRVPSEGPARRGWPAEA